MSSAPLQRESRERLDGRRRLTAAALVLAMALGSVLLWIGMPVGLLFLASRLQSGTQPSMGPYLVVLVGLLVCAILITRALAALDRAFARTIGVQEDRRLQLPWLRSLRGERAPGRRRTILDVVMVASVGLALLMVAVWFWGFAHPGVPQV